MKSYDKDKPSRNIKYLHANDLYGWGMIQYSPFGGFKQLLQDEVDRLNVGMIREDSLDGCIWEVNREYQEELHNLDNDYPLSLEKKEIRQDML